MHEPSLTLIGLRLVFERNRDSQRSKLARQLAQATHKNMGPIVYALTGTPIENHLSELWSIMDVLNPGLLGSARYPLNQFVYLQLDLGLGQRRDLRQGGVRLHRRHTGQIAPVEG